MVFDVYFNYHFFVENQWGIFKIKVKGALELTICQKELKVYVKKYRIFRFMMR